MSEHSKEQTMNRFNSMSEKKMFMTRSEVPAMYEYQSIDNV